MGWPHKASSRHRITGFESERSAQRPELELGPELPIETSVQIDSSGADQLAERKAAAEDEVDRCREAHYHLMQKDVSPDEVAQFIRRLSKAAKSAVYPDQIDTYRSLAQYWKFTLIRQGEGDRREVQGYIEGPADLQLSRKPYRAPLFFTPAHEAIKERHRALLMDRSRRENVDEIHAMLDYIVDRFSELTEDEQSQIRHFANYWNNTQGRITHEWRELDELYPDL